MNPRTKKTLRVIDLVLSIGVVAWAFAAEPEPTWVPVVIIVALGVLLTGIPELVDKLRRRYT